MHEKLNKIDEELPKEESTTKYNIQFIASKKTNFSYNKGMLPTDLVTPNPSLPNKVRRNVL